MFHFENQWAREDGCLRIVEECWEEVMISTLLDMLADCRESLKWWGCEFNSFQLREIKECKAFIGRLKGLRDPISFQGYQEAHK